MKVKVEVGVEVRIEEEEKIRNQTKIEDTKINHQIVRVMKVDQIEK